MMTRWLWVTGLVVLVGNVGSDGCDADEDGYTVAAGDCDDNDPSIQPGAEERANIVDDNCNGFADEPPVGLELDEGATALQGWATAVAHADDHVFVSGAATLLVYHEGTDGALALEARVDLRDVVYDMALDGDTLFLAAGNAGLVAVDVSDPAVPVIADQRVDFAASSVGARNGYVAVGHRNQKTVAVYPFDGERFGAPVFTYAGDDCMMASDYVSAVTLGGPSGEHLYVGYAGTHEEDQSGTTLTVQDGDLAYFEDFHAGPSVPAACLSRHGDDPIGAVSALSALDEADRSGVFLATERKTMQDVPSLRWVEPVCDPAGVCVLEEVVPCEDCYCDAADPEDCPDGTLLKGRGNAVAGDSSLVCVGGMHVFDYKLDDLWCVRDPFSPNPRPLSTRTLDLVYDLEFNRDSDGIARLYVADEWGGLQVYQPDTDLDRMVARAATGAQSFAVWRDRQTIYSVKEGAGLWRYQEGTGEDPVVLERVWSRGGDPTVACYDTEENGGDYDPTNPSCLDDVFVHAGVSDGQTVYLQVGNRFDIVGLDYTYFVAVDRDSGEALFQQYQSEHVSFWGIGSVVVEPLADGTNAVFLATGSNRCNDMDEQYYGPCLDGTFQEGGLRLYRHDTVAGTMAQAAFVPTGTLPSGVYAVEALDAAILGDYVFVPLLEFRWPKLRDLANGVFASEGIAIYRWRDQVGNLGLEEVSRVAPLDVHDEPYRLLVDEDHGLLLAGGQKLLAYPLTDTDGVPLLGTPVDLSPGDNSLNAPLAIWGMARLGNRLYVADPYNGIYGYDLSAGVETRPVVFYPTFDAASNQPIPLAADIRPLHMPRDLAVASDGALLVQEWISGRVSLLREAWASARSSNGR